MAGLSFIKNAAGDVLGDLGSTLLSEVIGGSNGVFFRAAPTAGRLLGAGSENYTFHTSSAPRPGFMYMVKFVTPLNASSTRTGFDPSSTMSSKTGFNFQAKSVDRPSVQIQQETVNQYNKKRIIYTGRTHSPVNIVFHDDIEGKLLRFWQSYFAHYFQDGTISGDSSVFWDMMANEFNDSGTDGIGLRTIPGTNEKYYFDKIVIYQFFGGYYTTVTLFNPMISAFQYTGQLAYDSSSGQTPEVTITFEYENFAYDMDPRQVTTSNAAEFGFQFDYNQPPLGISKQKIASYLDAFLQKNGITSSIAGVLSDALGLDQSTFGVAADNILRSVITQTVTNNTSKSLKNNILNVGINAFRDVINGNVNLNKNANQSTTGAFPIEDQYGDNGNSLFSNQYSGMATKLLDTGLYSQLSTNTTQINPTSFKSNSLIATNSRGEIQFTEKGLAGVNSLISQSTIFGVAEKAIGGSSSNVGTVVKSASALKNLFG